MSVLSFTVWAPGYLSTKQMFDIALYARDLAEALGFKQIQPVLALERDEIEQLLHQLGDGGLLETFFCNYFRLEEHLDYDLWAVHARRLVMGIKSHSEEYDRIGLLPPQRLVGFHASGGRGCTEFRLTFAQYPVEVVEVDSRLVFGWWAEDEVCEEQAYAYGEAHFVQCHLRHILLFKALKRRFPLLQVKISDALRYWNTGSLDTLRRRARKMFAKVYLDRIQPHLPQPAQVSPRASAKKAKINIPRDELYHIISRN